MKKLQIYSEGIYNLVKPKNAKTYIANPFSTKDINDMIKFLDLRVTGQKENNGNNAVVHLKYKNPEKTMLNMAYYTNALAQNFTSESMICHAITVLQYTKATTFTKT